MRMTLKKTMKWWVKLETLGYYCLLFPFCCENMFLLLSFSVILFMIFFSVMQAFSVAEKELGIPPQISASEMAKNEKTDILTIVTYLAQIYEAFKDEKPSKSPLIVLLLYAKWKEREENGMGWE